MRAYSSFAHFYDGLMKNAEYEKRRDYILELMKRHNHEMGLTLDLACGTGTLTRLLKKSGVDIYGADASGEMLSEAMRLSYEEELDILFIKQKMQSLDLYGSVNTCICTLDGINHLVIGEDVQKTFDRVALFTEPDGIFMFDVNTEYKHKEVLADNAFVYENDRVFCVWQNSTDERLVTEIDLDFFEEENGVYYRTSESFKERAYSDRLLREMLEKSGFSVEAVYGDLSFESPKADEQRAIYVTRKKS